MAQRRVRSPRRTSRSGTRGPRSRMFWVTNSIPETTLGVGAVTVSDLLSGTIPADRDALRRVRIIRMLLTLMARPVTSATLITFAFQVVEMTVDAILAGAVPEIGEDEVGAYLAEDGIVHTPNVGFQQWVKSYDIRTARALRGSDRSLGMVFTNQDATGSVILAASFRLLVSY